MDCGVAARSPAGRPADKSRMINAPEVDRSVPDRILCMAAQAKVRVGIDEHFPVDGAVRVVAGGAAFAQGFMLVHHRPRLLAMTPGTAFVEPRHLQSAGRFKNIAPVRVVALPTIHAAFNHRVMLRHVEFRLDFGVALETRGGIPAGVHNEFAATAAGLDMQAAGAVTGFAPALARRGRAVKVDAGVRTRGEGTHLVCVAILTCPVADVMCARDFRRNQDGWRKGGTRIQEQHRAGCGATNCSCYRCWL